MVEVIYRFSCDRCGKKVESEANYPEAIHDVAFREITIPKATRTVKGGTVCEECFKAFLELAESFFDDLNKGEEDGKAKAD
jgi:hypothetical protein